MAAGEAGAHAPQPVPGSFFRRAGAAGTLGIHRLRGGQRQTLQTPSNFKDDREN